MNSQSPHNICSLIQIHGQNVIYSQLGFTSVELLQLPSNISELHVVTLTRRQTVPKEMDRNEVSEVVQRGDVIYTGHMYSYNNVYEKKIVR